MPNRVCLIQLVRFGDIVSVLPIAKHLHDSGKEVHMMVHVSFKPILRAVSYVRMHEYHGLHRSVAGAIHNVKALGFKDDEIIATQADGNPVSVAAENYQLSQWVRAGMETRFHDLPLVFDRRDTKNEEAITRQYVPTHDGRPLLAYCLEGTSSKYLNDRDQRKWIEDTFAPTHRLLDLGILKLDTPQLLLPLLEKADCLLTIDTLPLHLAYATKTPTLVMSRFSTPDGQPSVYYNSEPRSHWVYRCPYADSVKLETRKEMERVIREKDFAPGRMLRNVEATPAPVEVKVSTGRQTNEKLTTIPGKVTRMDLSRGSFNAGMVALPESDKFVMVYRPSETTFMGCLLDAGFSVIPKSSLQFRFGGGTDPRLVWVGRKLLMVYSALGANNVDCIMGGVIMDLDVSKKFIEPARFRISPPSPTRQKNWMPFVSGGRIMLISSVNPHEIYELQEFRDGKCPLVSESPWKSPWIDSQIMRGNAPPVQLADGNWLGTFHTVTKDGKMHYYDNGCYVFSGKPPFNVLRCANRTYLKAEDAIEPHFRKAGLITVAYPVGMVRQDNRLLISYGDNDSSCKILECSVKDMLDTTVEVVEPGRKTIEREAVMA